MMHVKEWCNRSGVALLVVSLVVVLAACGVGTPATPAQPSTSDAPAAVEATEAPAEAIADATEAPVEEATATNAGEAPADETDTSTGTRTFTIDPAQSEVRFILTEMLMGTHTTVVGSGNGIEGSITVNFDDYGETTISPIVIDASLLATDNNMRNGQIRRAILQTNQPEFQFITFTPTAVEGLPEDVTMGEPFDLTVTGDLTIRTVTQPISFEVTVTPNSPEQIQGNARATLLREDFDLQIPRVPSVADVSEEIQLEFDFVAETE